MKAARAGGGRRLTVIGDLLPILRHPPAQPTLGERTQLARMYLDLAGDAIRVCDLRQAAQFIADATEQIEGIAVAIKGMRVA